MAVHVCDKGQRLLGLLAPTRRMDADLRNAITPGSSTILTLYQARDLSILGQKWKGEDRLLQRRPEDTSREMRKKMSARQLFSGAHNHCDGPAAEPLSWLPSWSATLPIQRARTVPR